MGIRAIAGLEYIACLILMVCLEIESASATAGAVASAGCRAQGIAPIAGERVVLTILR
jgi:hypothetical protein